jgi:hypothetical protein
MVWLTTLATAPASRTSAAAFSSVTATTGRPSASIQLPAVREAPRSVTSSWPVRAARVSALGVSGSPDVSLATACVTISPPQASPPMAASRAMR